MTLNERVGSGTEKQGLFPAEEMTSTQRVAALLAGKETGRVPFFPFSLGFSALNVGYPVATVYSDPEKSYTAQLLTQRMYGYDQDPFLGYAAYGTYELGARPISPPGIISMRLPVCVFRLRQRKILRACSFPTLRRPVCCRGPWSSQNCSSKTAQG